MRKLAYLITALVLVYCSISTLLAAGVLGFVLFWVVVIGGSIATLTAINARFWRL
jgi:hypothetical protein